MIACLLLNVSVGVAQDAPRSPDPEAKARAHFEAGTQAYDTGDYDLAVKEFRASYAVIHHPDLLYNIYLASERGGHLGDAVAALSKYLDEATIAADRRPALEQRLARLQEREAKEGAETAPSSSTRPAEPVRPPAQPPPPKAPPRVSPVAVGLLAGAGALAVSFVVFASLSQAEDNHLSDTCGVACSSSQIHKLRVYNAMADLSWTTGLAMGATGLVLLFVLKKHPDAAESAAHASAWVRRDGGGLVVGGRF